MAGKLIVAIDKAYEQMAQDEVREKDAADWCEGLTGVEDALRVQWVWSEDIRRRTQFLPAIRRT